MRGLEPSGRWSRTYVEDRRVIRSKYHVIGVALLAVGLIAYPSVVSSDWLRFGVITAITLIAVVGLQLLVGSTGQVSIGQSAFVGMGAYASGVAAVSWGLSLVPTLVIGGLGAAAVGVIFGLPTVRIRGFYLALTTLAAQFVFAFLVVRLPEDTFGGEAGIFMPPPVVFGVDMSGAHAFYFLTIVVAVLAVVTAWAIQQSSLGRAFAAVRDNDVAAEMTGVPVKRLKLMAFALASAFAGVSGALLSYENGFVNVAQYTLFTSVLYLGMLIVGGLGSILGAVLGVLVLSLIEHVVVDYGADIFELFGMDVAGRTGSVVNIVVGLAVCLMLIIEPRGLADLYRRVERSARLWPFPHSGSGEE
jgi:branched-chain amino acid transport system permease protein